MTAGSAVRVPRIVQINYAIRSAAFAYCFVVMGLLFWERQMSLAAWGMLALQFLAYPHLVWMRARFSRDPRRVELQNLNLDSVFIGIWVAMAGFPTWIAYGGIFSVALNSAVMRGWRGAAIAVVGFCAGAMLWVVPMGLTHLPHTSALVSALCFAGALAYSCGVGVVVFGQNRRLRVARDELRAEERRYRLITEHAGDLVAMVDRDGRWLYTSPSYARIFRAEDLAVGRDAFRNVHEEDQFRVRGAVQGVMRNGESCRLRVRLHTSTGDVRRFEATVQPVREGENASSGEIGGANDRITAAVMASRDVTELRDREEQVEVAAHAFERMAEGMVITNVAGRILTVNQAYSRITGYSSEEVVGRQESEFRSAMQAQTFYDDIYAEVLRSGHWDGTTWCRRRDGTVYREWRSVSAVRDAGERITHYVTLFREVNGHGGVQERVVKTA
jgi:PAS domain S-box-containing protein